MVIYTFFFPHPCSALILANWASERTYCGLRRVSSVHFEFCSMHVVNANLFCSLVRFEIHSALVEYTYIPFLKKRFCILTFALRYFQCCEIYASKYQPKWTAVRYFWGNSLFRGLSRCHLLSFFCFIPRQVHYRSLYWFCEAGIENWIFTLLGPTLGLGNWEHCSTCN